MRKNLPLDTDAYKLTHWLGYPENLTKLYSYGEARVGSKYPRVCFFGLSGIIQEHFLDPITDAMIKEGEEESFDTFGTPKYFNTEVWRKVQKLGYLPIKIKAAPEGTVVDVNNVLFTNESTQPWFAKTLNSLEGTLMHVWYPTTVSTRAMNIMDGIKPAFYKSSDIADLILQVAVNDFGYRGATCHEAAARGGAGFALHFVGSDNLPANRFIKDYYGFRGRIKSVWATEHSVATSFGLTHLNEIEYLKHQLINSDPKFIISVVIDSNDSNEFIQTVAGDAEIMEMIKARTGRVVFRPDTGKPLTNVCRHSDQLGSIFGFNMNSKGYKVINHNVGLLQGDGMDEVTIPELYNEYIKTGWAADNTITGSGGGLLQVDINRDTERFAIKASHGERDGKAIDIHKNPKTDPSKASKAGMLKLHTPTHTIASSEKLGANFNNYNDILQTVLEDGKFYPQKFEDVLSNLQNSK